MSYFCAEAERKIEAQVPPGCRREIKYNKIVNCKYLIIHSPQVFSGIIYNTGWGTLPDCLGCSLQVLKEMSDDAPIHECESEIDHYTGHYVPYSLRRVCGFFNIPQIYYMCKGL